ncbi:Afadin and alpha-actinin-binding-domain-containing protein [Amylocystis lapponica]|nr:Afadin and alpha-actinin-binding-domain-containing protein [Amylocystis lapponica]
MADTPRRLVHWALDVSLSDFGSPFSNTSSESISSTSSLQYINSQLIAHGFTHQPGLSLEGLSKDDTEKVVKCLLSMLGQRVDDISRTEDLTTKIRTLSYDHERLLSMYRTSTEKTANAEREMNVHKSRLTSVTRSLHSAEAAHKHTTAELQRTRTSLQAIRTAHHTEFKKLEKEKERMSERWNRLADTQLKAGGLVSGLTCANAVVVDTLDVQPRGVGHNFLEDALEQAERAREALFEQNRRFRGVILSAANELQSLRGKAVAEGQNEMAPLTLTTLFPMSPADTAGEKIAALITSVREAISQLAESAAVAGSGSTMSSTAAPSGGKETSVAEVDRLQKVVETLRAELEQTQKQSAAYAAQTQDLFDRFAEDQRLMQGEVGEMSVDLMTCTARDEEKHRLDARARELEEERKKFTDAAVRLGREKAALEAERIKFMEEKRSWQVDLMLAELPPTPGPSTPAIAQATRKTVAIEQPPERQLVCHPPLPSPRRSPRKAKGAVAVGKASSSKKTRVSRRSSGCSVALGPISPRKVIPAFETEVIPSPARQMPAFKTSIAASQAQPPALVGAFVLPPASPAASLSMQYTTPSIPPLPRPFDIPSIQVSAPSAPAPQRDTHEAQPQPVASASAPAAAVPSTPIARRPFPMAKPLVPSMIHAYSPVRPSPLSRILMLANSPDSPEDRIPQLNVLAEEDESEDTDSSPIPGLPAPVKSLAAELGVADDSEPPLRDKTEQNVVKPKGVRPMAQKAAPKVKGKGKAEPLAAPRLFLAVAPEKENVKRAKSSLVASSAVGATAQKEEKKAVKAPSKSMVAAPRPKLSAKLPPGKGGARRVPIDSAEAAPVGPGWKG